MSEAGVRRVFWGWTRPVPESAAAFLAEERPVSELEDTVVVVPTAEAGRRLRRALAEAADARGGAVSVPHVWTPQTALAPMEDRERAASELEARLVWVRVLRGCAPQGFRALLPSVPEPVSWRWLWDLAGTLTELQELLGAGGLTAGEVAARAEGLPGAEVARWRDLARMEGLFQGELAKLGRSDPQRLKRERAESPRLPEGVRRVVVLAAPDLPPLMTRWLESCARSGLEVVVAVKAGTEEAEGFDGWGRPLRERWGEEAAVDARLEECAIRLCRDPAGQAEEVVRWLAEAAEDGLPVAVGVCDAEVTPLLKEKLEARGLVVFEPGGVPVKREGLWHLLSLTGELLGTGSWRAFCGLMRIEEVRRAWCGGAREGAVRELDKFAEEHLPGSLELAEEMVGDGAAATPGLRKAMAEAGRWRRRLLEGGLAETGREWLVALYGERHFQTEAPGDRERVQAAWAWLAEAEEVERMMAELGLEAGRLEEWAMVMERFGGGVIEPARGEVDLAPSGWLELLWESAAALVVAGMNEENVPGVLLGHPFLPDRFRQELGLPCQATRFARDAYLLTAMVRQREDGGRFGVTVGRWSGNEDVLKPSRLLTLCPEEKLAGRVRHLFAEKGGEEEGGEPPRSVLWRLEPRREEMEVETISPSRIAAYLDCPFRFYLRYGLGMREVREPGREMDAMRFGNLAHEVLRQYGEDAEARQWVEVARIQRWFRERVEEVAEKQFGRRLPPLVRLQVEAAAQRLHWQAEVEARERRSGWEILAVELELGGEEDERPLLIEGARFRGKVDRLEVHEGSGERRVLDFKTADKAEAPLAAHCKPVKEVKEEERWKTFAIGDKTWRWKDMQLPLYGAALRRRGPGPVTQAGYACLPKGVMETELRLWEGYDERWEEAAMACAAEVVRRVRAGEFWPPNEGAAKFREVERLFPGGVLEAVRWE